MLLFWLELTLIMCFLCPAPARLEEALSWAVPAPAPREMGRLGVGVGFALHHCFKKL